MATTSQQWWDQTKTSPELIAEWLKQQFHGEVTASDRIERYCVSTAPAKWTSTLTRIANDERTHAGWIAGLLEARGIEPALPEKNERYWDAVSTVDPSFENVTAIASHAEAMRLERIKVIACDEAAPEDIRLTFTKILRDELFHEKAFREMAGSSAMESTESLARSGRAALGLINPNEVM